MSILISPDSPDGKELARWNTPKNQKTDHGLLGMKNVGYEEYPKCLYRAGRPTKANVEISGSLTVRDESEERVALGQGWSRTQEDAIERNHDRDREMAKLAANRAYQERTMSESAQREAAAFESDTVQHVPVIPETPIKTRKKPGPKPKTANLG
jgi:hypothetical protein